MLSGFIKKQLGKMNIKNGDKIELSNKYGKQIGEALLTEGIRKDTVFAYFGFGHVSKGLKRAYGKESIVEYYCHTLLSVTGMNLHTCGVKVRKRKGIRCRKNME